jgi:hypothetical protein
MLGVVTSVSGPKWSLIKLRLALVIAHSETPTIAFNTVRPRHLADKAKIERIEAKTD